MTGANIDRCQYLQASKITKKLLSSLNSPSSISSEYEISSKLKHLPFLVQNYGLKDDRRKHWQVSRIIKNYCNQWIQYLQIVHYAKFRGKWLTSFPVSRSSFFIPCFPFPFLKIANSWLLIFWNFIKFCFNKISKTPLWHIILPLRV